MSKKLDSYNFQINRDVLFEKTNKNLHKLFKAIECYDSEIEVHKFNNELKNGYIICHYFPLLGKYEFGDNSKITICKLSYVTEDFLDLINEKDSLNSLKHTFWGSVGIKIVDLREYGISSNFIAMPDIVGGRDNILKLFARYTELVMAFEMDKARYRAQDGMFLTDDFPLRIMATSGFIGTGNYHKHFQAQQKRGVQTVIKSKFRVSTSAYSTETSMKFKQKVLKYIKEQQNLK